jgi:hypothetical protein
MAKKCALWIAGILLFNYAALAALQPTVLPVNFGQYGGAVAVGPENTLVTWVDYRRTEDINREIFGTRVGPTGEVLDGDGIPLTGVADGQAAVAALDDQFLIVWSRGPNIYARRMTSGGELLDTQPIVVRTGAGHPFPELVYLELSAAADGANFWVAWADDRSMPAGTPEHMRYEYQDIYAARISPAGRVLDPRGIRICTRQGNQHSPRLSPKADFIVWNDARPARRCIFGSRLNPRGIAQDPNGFEIFRSREHQLTAPDISGNGTGWLVVWGEGMAIYGAKVTRPRGLSSIFRIGTIMQLTPPQVETSGRDFLVLWQDGASTVGRRVTAAKRVGQQVTLAADESGGAYYSFGSFAGNGSRFYVTGTTAPINSSWFYNDVWHGTFGGRILP